MNTQQHSFTISPFHRKPAIRAYTRLAGGFVDRAKPIDPVAEAPARRGRPRQYHYSSEAERKRVARAAAALQIEEMLAQYGLSPTTPIPASTKEKLGITAETYSDLLKSDEVRKKVFDDLMKELAAEHKLLHGKTRTAGSEERYMYMADAPKGCGRLVSGGYDSEKISAIYGAKEEALVDLSKPGTDPDPRIDGIDRRRAKKYDCDEVTYKKVRTDDSGTETTFRDHISWPKSWLTKKYAREYAEIAEETLSRISQLLSRTEEGKLGYSEEGHQAETVHYCSLCDHRLGPWVTVEHFIRDHTDHVRKLFQTAGVRFRKAYFRTNYLTPAV
jgi:hypothetical protein